MWPIMRATRRPRLRHDAVRVVVAAVEVGVGDDRAPRHLVEGDVLRRQVGRGRHRDALAQPLGIAQRPGQRLHAAEAAAEHRGELLDAERVDQARLRVDPVLDGDDREVAAVGAAVRGRIGVRARRPGRAEARAGVVDADDEEAVGVERLAGADQVVPPALALRLAGVGAGDVVRGVERVADEHGVAAARRSACRRSRRRACSRAAPRRCASGSGAAKCIDCGWTSPTELIGTGKKKPGAAKAGHRVRASCL